MSIFIDKQRLLTSSDTFSGGVNLFRNTDKLDKFWGPAMGNNGQADSSANYASDVNHESIATKSVFHVYGSQANQAGLKSTQQIYFEQGVYTISFLARNNGTDFPSFSLELYSDYTDQHTGLPLGSTSANLTNVWQQYSITFRIDQAGTYGDWRLIKWSNTAIPGGSLYFANLKLERGPVATDWCPAYADYAMKSDLDNEDIAWQSGIQHLKQTMLKCVPHVNLLQNSAGPFFPQPDPKSSSQQTDVNAIDQWQVFLNSTVTLVKGETYTVSAATNGVFSSVHDPSTASNKCVIWIGPPISMVISGENTSANTFTWNSDTGTYPLRVNRYGADSQVKCWNIKIEHGSQATDWTPCPLDS